MSDYIEMQIIAVEVTRVNVKLMSDYIEMQIIAVEVTRSNHGDFLKNVAHAWVRADPGNKAILEQAWRDLIHKYGLDKEYAREIQEHYNEYVEEES